MRFDWCARGVPAAIVTVVYPDIRHAMAKLFSLRSHLIDLQLNPVIYWNQSRPAGPAYSASSELSHPETHDIQVITEGTIKDVKIETFNPSSYGDLIMHDVKKLDATHILLILAAQPVPNHQTQVQVLIIVTYQPSEDH